MLNSYSRRRPSPHVLLSAALEIGVATLCFHLALAAALLPNVGKATSLAAVFALSALASALAAGTYDARKLHSHGKRWARRLFMYGMAFSGALLADVAGLQSGVGLPVHGLATIIAICGGLMAHTAIASIGTRTVNKRTLIVLGAGSLAANIAKLEDALPSWRCVMFLGLPGEKGTFQDPRIQTAGCTSLSDYVASKAISEIVVAVDDRSQSLPMSELVEVRKDGVLVTNYQDFIEREYGWIDTGTLNDTWFLRHGTIRNRKWRTDTKRFIDIALSLVFLMLTAPLCSLIALAIKLDDGGPVFFHQSRIGLHGRDFTMLKFRSMRQTGDKSPMWSGSGDTRITRFGTFLRRSRLDELPQLMNVLSGDMSLVGPRPEQPFFVEKLQREIPYYSKRLWLKPGLTGWAQVNFPYAATVDDARIKQGYDLYYLAHWGFLMDCQILLKTIGTLIWPAHPQEVSALSSTHGRPAKISDVTKHSRSA